MVGGPIVKTWYQVIQWILEEALIMDLKGVSDNILEINVWSNTNPQNRLMGL